MFRLFNQLAPTLPPANSAALFKASVGNETSPGIWQQIVGKPESKAAAAAATRFSCDVCLDHKAAGAAFGAAAHLHLHLQRLAGKIAERGRLSLSLSLSAAASAAWRLRRSVSSNVHLKKTIWPPPLSSSLSPARAAPLTWMGIILSSRRSHSASPFNVVWMG